MNRYRLLRRSFCISLLVFGFNTAFSQCFNHYSFSPTGNICGSSTDIILSGSDPNVSYQLQVNGSNYGSPVWGNGSSIDLGTVTSSGSGGGGTFLVVASQDGSGCSPTVIAGASVYFVPAPAGSISSNSTVICGNNPVTLTINPSVSGTYSYQWYENGSYLSGQTSSTMSATAAGTYTATISNSCGTSSLNAVTLTAAPGLGPLTPITGSPSLPANTATSSYTASAANASSYIWAISPSTAGTISGAGTTGTVSWNTTYSGVATVSVAASGGCTGTGPAVYFAVAYNSSNYDYNYVKETDVRVPNITSVSSLASLPIGQINITYTYFDGLGRPIQKVMQGASATGNDVVAPRAYDQMGREVYKYMIYTASGAPGAYRYNALTGNNGYTTGAQYQFYQVPNANYVNTNYPYAQATYEGSSLDRVIEKGGNGAVWQVGGGHTIRPNYSFNNNISWSANQSTSMQVALYTATINNDGSRTLSRANNNTATYNANQLKVTVTEDENWGTASGRAGTVEEYTDIMGHEVLKRVYNNNNGTIQVMSTYYIYDTGNSLAFVLTPMSNPDGTTGISQTTLDNLCYQYQYDERKRMTAKKLPGKGWEYTVYNNADQVVATQDAIQAGNNQWKITKYDGLGRVIITGLWNNNNSAITPSQLKANIYAAPQWDSFNPSSTNGYTINSYPQTLNTILTINYYDGYAAPSLPANYTYSSGSNMTYGLLTATKTTVLNTIANSQPDMLWTVNYYDNIGRVVQSFQQHYLNGTGSMSTNNFDAINTTYDFTNVVTTQTRKHYNTLNSAYPLSLTILNSYYYDQTGHKISTWEQLTNGANGNVTPDTKTLISKNIYNEVGQVMTKNLHSTDSLNFLQSVNYSYNERGWLTGSTAPLFSMQLQYNNNANNLSSFTAQYNGNIASQIWTSSGQPTNNYSYTYDNLNRLTNGVSSNGFSEQNITYDLNGNITALQRSWNRAVIDQLAYNYQVSGNPTNLLQTIQDTNTDNSGNGYQYGTFGYQYDANGSLSYDAFRGRTVTQSNLLNLPQTNVITGSSAGTITYFYDANGKKLRKTATQGIGTNTDYIDGIQYSGAFSQAENISFIQTEEGRAIPNSATSYNYDYNLADHLGNVRVMFDSKSGGGVIEENDYLPYGTKIPYSNANPKNDYLYNKKELQEEFTAYDYGARFYDPVIGRWNSVDPHAENYQNWTPYSYVANNPMVLTDPDGMDWFYHSTDGKSDPTWVWHDGSTYDTGVKDLDGNEVVLQGQEAVVTFNGSVDEKLGSKSANDAGYDRSKKNQNAYIDGHGAVTADVTVYGPNGPSDIQHYTGYTMTSDPSKYGPIADGDYNVTYLDPGKGGALSSHWAVNGGGQVLDYWTNPAHPGQINKNGKYYSTGIYIHSTNKSGYAGPIGSTAISVGCLLISAKDWKNFNNQLQGVSNFLLQVTRTTHIPYRPSQMAPPYNYLNSKIIGF